MWNIRGANVWPDHQQHDTGSDYVREEAFFLEF